MPLNFQNKYADFSDLAGLAAIFDDAGVLVLEGVYDNAQPNPGPHALLTSPNSKHGYDFIKQPDGSYVVRVHRMDGNA